MVNTPTESPRPMPVTHLELGQQAVRSRVSPSNASHPLGVRATSGGRRLQNLARSSQRRITVSNAPKGRQASGSPFSFQSASQLHHPPTTALSVVRKIRCPRGRITDAPAAESPSPTLAGSRGSLSQREPRLPPLRPPTPDDHMPGGWNRSYVPGSYSQRYLCQAGADKDRPAQGGGGDETPLHVIAVGRRC